MHMHLHLDRNRPDKNRLELDGTDITPHVLTEGFGIDLNSVEGLVLPVVTLRVKPDTVTIDGDVVVDVKTEV